MSSPDLEKRKPGAPTRLRLELAGAVQGVGFRPSVHQLANELGIGGWIRNSAAGVEIEIEDLAETLETFERLLEDRLPPQASITSKAVSRIQPIGEREFRIENSAVGRGDAPPAEIVPDLATCDECLAEIFDPSNRRFGYPFTNCSHCGPRFSIALSLPYDRHHTTMRNFAMCDRCRAEYDSPNDRRFHAQPNACPECGPQLCWTGPKGTPPADREAALEQAARAIEGGAIIAVKGIGGFHLLTDARCPDAIGRLRRRKHRPAKPFAVMMPSLEVAREYLILTEQEIGWLCSPAAPIVLAGRREPLALPDSLAPGNPWLGAMLPYSPLHHLLLRRLGFPVVATSGNLGDEPICIDDNEALVRLGDIADGFLTHDRPIARAVDDSLVREAAGRQLILRRSRGFAPAPIPAPPVRGSILAYGGDLKGTIAVADRGRIRLSQHLGDLESLESRRAYQQHLSDFPLLCQSEPQGIACDEHPAYHSHRLAREAALPLFPIQHHHAHAIACGVENGVGIDEAFLAVAWDGTGYGRDGTVWGGEFLSCRGSDFDRFAWLRPFPLPGSHKAVRDPRFTALGCLHAAGIDVHDTPLGRHLDPEEIRVSQQLIERGVNTPLCSSAGRLFDAAAAVCGLARETTFEGQAAMALEFAAADPGIPEDAYQVSASAGEIDWCPLFRGMVNDLNQDGASPASVARKFHHTLADLIVAVALESGLETIALTGGCFQNKLLLELSVDKLKHHGLRPIWHQQLPPNDGGLAFGQAVIASLRISSEPE